MELSHVEPVAEFARGVGSQLLELQLADLVRERLARHVDVAVDLHDDVVLGLAGVLFEVVDGLLARPPFRVHARIDDQAHGAPHLVRQLSELRVRVLVEPELGTERLCVEAPPFDEGGVPAEAAELGQLSQFLRDRNLQMMSRHRLVQRQRFHLPLRARRQVVRVRVKQAGAATLDGSAVVVRGGLGFLGVCGNGHDAVRQTRQRAENFRQLRIDALGDVAIRGQQRLPVGEVELRIRSQEREELGERPLEARGTPQFLHLRTDPLHLGEAEVVDGVRRHGGGCVGSDEVRVPFAPVGHR